jgi:hypothetical protein
LEDSKPVQRLEGHALRVSTTQFHPSGRFLGTAGQVKIKILILGLIFVGNCGMLKLEKNF